MDTREPKPGDKSPGPQTYYEKEGRGVEGIVRCDGCAKLVITSRITGKGGCPHCAHRRFNEVRVLGLWEQIKLRTGIIDFPGKDKFLKEFSRGDA